MPTRVIDIWVQEQQIRLAATAVGALQDGNAASVRALRDSLTEFIVSTVSTRSTPLTSPTRRQLGLISSDYWEYAGFEDFGSNLREESARRDWGCHADTMLASHALTLLGQRHVSIEDFLTWAIRVSPPSRSGRGGWMSKYWKNLRSVFDVEDGECANKWLQLAREGGQIDERIEAINNLSVLETASPGGRIASPWQSLCLELLGQQFSWPLLGARVVGLPFGTSLPAALALEPPRDHGGGNDVRFFCRMGEREATYLKGQAADNKKPRIDRFSDGTLAWTGEFLRSFPTSLAAAKQLWKSQNGRVPEAERQAVLRLGLTVDWSFANRIATIPALEEFLVEGRSAEVYFSQVILAQLLSASKPVGVATGTIDLHETTLPLGWVEDISYKTRYAQHTGIFPRLILPKRASTELEQGIREALVEDQESARMEVNYCPTARSAADAMQRSGWRRTAFVRAPEDRFAFYEALGRLHLNAIRAGDTADSDVDIEVESQIGELEPMEDWRLEKLKQQTRDWIMYGAKGLRWFKLNPQDCRPKILGRWLAWLDHSTRVDRAALTGPGLGILCLRLAIEDNEMRVWSRLFHMLDVHPALWRRFQWATPQQAREILARVLNNFGCNPEISVTPPPDLLVIVDDGGATRQRTNRIFPEDFRGQMRDVFAPHLGSLLGVRDEARARVLGKTRIVVLQPDETVPPNDCLEAPSKAVGYDLDPLEKELVGTLNVFRAGFSVQAATTVMRTRDAALSVTDAHKKLNELVQRRVLGRHRGEYFLRWDYRTNTGNVYHSPEAHFVAAKALAPILDADDSFVADNRDKLFDEWGIHDALWHLRHAYMESFPRQARIRSLISDATLTLLTLMPTPDWDLIRPLAGTGAEGIVEALDLSADLLETESDIRGAENVHSSRFALAINVIAKRLSQERDEQTSRSLLERACTWFSSGSAALNDGATAAQAVKLLSEFAYCLRSAGALDANKSKLLADVEQRLNDALDQYWKHKLDSSDVPMSREYMRLRVLDGSRAVRDRSKDARIACELWGSRTLESLNQWFEPWTWLLALMRPSDFAPSEVAAVLDLMNQSESDSVESARTVSRRLRLSSYWKPFREQGTRAAVTLYEWLVLRRKDRLWGHRANIAFAYFEEWIAESHNCFDLANAIEMDALVDALRHLQRSLQRQGCDPHKARLAASIFKDSWGCWSLLSRLQESGNDGVSLRDRYSLLLTMASLQPGSFFEPGFEVSSGRQNMFTEKAIPANYFKARRLSLEWLRSLKSETRHRRDLQKGINDLESRLQPFMSRKQIDEGSVVGTTPDVASMDDLEDVEGRQSDSGNRFIDRILNLGIEQEPH